MSHQSFPGQSGPQQPQYGAPPAGPAPYVQQPSAPFSPAPTRGPRRKGMLIAGIIVLLLGVIGGGALLVSGGKNYEDAVADLARAPIGCTTSLEFDKTGTFTVYVETDGEVGNLRGDCANSDSDYSRGDDDLPSVDLVLTNEEGDEIDIDDADDKDYDINGFVGQSIGSIEIDETGPYELTVSSEDDDFAIAIGKDPKDNAKLAGVGLIAVIVGAVLGILLIVLGMRRKPVTPGVGGTGIGGPGVDPMGGAPLGYGQPQYAPTMQQPSVPPATYPPSQPNYAPPPTAPMPVTPPSPAPGTWSPPPPQL